MCKLANYFSGFLEEKKNGSITHKGKGHGSCVNNCHDHKSESPILAFIQMLAPQGPWRHHVVRVVIATIVGAIIWHGLDVAAARTPHKLIVRDLEISALFDKSLIQRL
jgi:hypothetical protein